MGVVTGGGGGGAAFNGGTITNPLLINNTGHPGSTALDVEADPAQTQNVVDLVGTVCGFTVDPKGAVGLSANGDLGGQMVSVNYANAQSDDTFAVNQNFSPFATVARFNKGGYLGIRTHTAPADGDVATGEAMLWFDQTNGAAKLMVKAKSANGTVVTGSVNLA